MCGVKGVAKSFRQMLTSRAISDGYVWLSGVEREGKGIGIEEGVGLLRVHNCYTRPHPVRAGNTADHVALPLGSVPNYCHSSCCCLLPCCPLIVCDIVNSLSTPSLSVCLIHGSIDYGNSVALKSN